MANEFIDVVKKINNAIRSDRGLRTALSSTLAVHKQRIFKQGLTAGSGKIGTYSTKKISISKKQQARNTGRTVFKGGYAEYKRAIGKGGDVNFRNTDQMMMDYGIVGASLDYGFGFQNSKNFQKTQWLEEKYRKKVFDLTRNEERVLGNVLTDEMIKALG